MITSAKFHLRVSGITEGISYLLLLGIAMPLKYYYDTPGPVRYIGMAHGVLFIWFVLSVFWAKSALNMNIKNMLAALVASLVPFGTFYADRKIFRSLHKS
ncbi:MAG: hypothetical protein FD123_161 [Bacteroidetes bacterium]|nr:MAG: hypothetical protein FD123_161 [Bacteroidota bacterium]